MPFAKPIALALCLACALPAGATEPGEGPALSGAEFEARVQGRTLYYLSEGQDYGAEQYLPGRRVVWAFTGDDCRKGEWWEAAPGEICFAYEDTPDAQCWTFHEGPKGLIGYFLGAPGSAPLIATEESRRPLACLGPQIGV